MDSDDLALLSARVEQIEKFLEEKLDFEPIVGTIYDRMRGEIFVTQAEYDSIKTENDARHIREEKNRHLREEENERERVRAWLRAHPKEKP